MATFPAVLVTGARQTGKTTLLQHELAETHRYVSLERPDVRQRALADPLAFFAEHQPPIVLDEVQYATALLPYIKELIDQDRRPGSWLLTGSQKFALMRGVSETLAGRVAVLELGPLSVGEAFRRPVATAVPGPQASAGASIDALLARVFASAADATPAPPPMQSDRPELADWLLRGGYPEPRLDARVDRQLWFSSYVQTYLQRDVRDLLHVADLTAFTQYLALLASRTGTLVNLADLGREIGSSAPTMRRWLSVLETSQVVQLLPAYHRSFGKRVRKSPKLVFSDPGLASFLAGLHSAEAILHGPMLGQLVETAVIGEWIKAARNAGEALNLYHWRSSGGDEVDLVIERGHELYALEIKATATPTPRHAEGLARWLALAGNARAALACRVDRPLALRPGIRAVPWHLAW